MSNEEAKLFVAGLPDSISEDVLRQLFEAAGGTVVSVSLPKDRATGRPRGFGFVTLSTPAEAHAARDALDGSIQAGKSISVRPFQAEPPRREGGFAGPGGAPGGYGGAAGGFGGPPSGSRGGPPMSRGPGGGGGAGPASNAPDRTLYVGNLPYDCTIEEVEALINTAVEGSVVRVYFPVDPDGRKRGFGFVTLASPEAAKAAADALRSAELRSRRLVINLKGDRPPPRSEQPRAYGGGGGGMGGGPMSGGMGGGPPMSNPAFFAQPPPAASRKPYDDRKKKFSEDGGGPVAAAGSPKKRTGEREKRNVRYDDYGDDDD